jgi:hypothetical protein
VRTPGCLPRGTAEFDHEPLATAKKCDTAERLALAGADRHAVEFSAPDQVVGLASAIQKFNDLALLELHLSK